MYSSASAMAGGVETLASESVTRELGLFPHKQIKRPSRNKTATKKPARQAPPSSILQAFNTWAFKREQPDNASAMLDLITAAISAGRPLSFVLYWGKGPRSYVAEPEIACLDYLATLERRIREVYAPGAHFTLIFTDTHAELNGHSAQNIAAYFDEMKRAADRRGFSSCRLSALVADAERQGAIDIVDEPLPADVLERLRACAAKWFRGDGSIDEGADRYYRMNLVERRAVEVAFPTAIFTTFNGSEFRCLFPENMPVFFMYSIRRGVSVKPWFMDASDAAA